MKKTSLLLLLAASMTPRANAQSLRDLPVWLSAEVRERYDNPELPLFNNEYGTVDPRHGALPFFFSRIRIGLLAEPVSHFSAFAQLQDSRFWGEEQGTVNNLKGVDLHQGWLQLGDRERFFRVGRQEYALGEERLFGRDDWYETGRAFDMVRLRSPLGGGRWIGEILYAETTNPIPDNEDEAFELLAVTRLFRWGQVTGYGVEKHDSHKGPVRGNKLYIGTFGLHATLHAGPWDVDFEGAGQIGRNFDDDKGAGFGAGYLRRRMGWRRPVTLGFEFSRASGDGEDGDFVSRDFDPLYPTRHDKYGFLDLLTLTNQRQLALTADVSGDRPGDLLHIAVRKLSLENPAGRWVNARGETIARDRTGGHGRDLGWELDLGLTRKVFREIDLFASVQGGYFRGGRYARDVANIVQAYEWTITLTYRVGRTPEGSFR